MAWPLNTEPCIKKCTRFHLFSHDGYQTKNLTSFVQNSASNVQKEPKNYNKSSSFQWHHKLGTFCHTYCTGGPRILWFLVPESNHEMRGSWIPRTVFSVKPHNGSKKIWKSTIWAFFPYSNSISKSTCLLNFLKLSFLIRKS